MSIKFHELLNARELAAKMGCSRQFIYMLINRGMPALWVNGRRFDLAEVTSWLDKNRRYEKFAKRMEEFGQ